MALCKKTLTLILFLFIAFLAFIGLSSDILIDDKIFLYLIYTAITITVLSYIFFFIQLKNCQSGLRQCMHRQGHSFCKIILAIVLGTPIFVLPAVTRGIPAVIHNFTATQGHMDVTIARKVNTHYSMGCHGGAYLLGRHFFYNDRICGIPDKDWQELNKGDQIRLYGKASVIGFTYDQYTMLDYVDTDTDYD